MDAGRRSSSTTTSGAAGAPSSSRTSRTETRPGQQGLPLIVGDDLGFGSVTGHLRFPPGTLREASESPRGATEENTPPPIGFSGHFLDPHAWAPPVASPWRRLRGSGEQCLFSGTLRLGPVPRYREGGRVFGGFRPA